MTHCWYLNWNTRCAVCFRKPEKGLRLLKHHITYFPELVAYVHFDCHKIIHEPDSPLDMFIQYNDGDSRKFYELQKEISFKRNVKRGVQE